MAQQTKILRASFAEDVEAPHVSAVGRNGEGDRIRTASADHYDITREGAIVTIRRLKPPGVRVTRIPMGNVLYLIEEDTVVPDAPKRP